MIGRATSLIRKAICMSERKRDLGRRIYKETSIQNSMKTTDEVLTKNNTNSKKKSKEGADVSVATCMNHQVSVRLY